MPRTLSLVACGVLWASSLSAQGDSLYGAWCARCHGADAHGTPVRSARLSVPPADLASCPASTAETEDQWTGIVARGGAAYGLSLDMPAYGDAGTPEQIRMVVRYVRSLCRERGWPPGELNFPRGFLVEKAYPENEVVIAARGAEQSLMLEHRVGRRMQFEAEVRSVFDGFDRPFDGITAAWKVDVWHSGDLRAIATTGVEVTPRIGRADRWELEPFLLAGVERGGFVLQTELVGSWEDAEGVTGGSVRGGVGRAVGRVVPMLEVGWDLPRGGDDQVTLYPQLWIRLSRLGHVAASLGAEVPAAGGHSRLIGFLLWDFGDAPLLRGW